MDSFRIGSSGGLSGLRPQHLKDCLSRRTGESGKQILFRLTDLVNAVLAGDVAEAVRPVFVGASLTAFNKKGGGIRPIAVGNTLRRLSAKCATRSVCNFSEVFAPAQLGFGVRGGAEAAAHAGRSFARTAGTGDVLLKLDFKNAFNSMRRDHVAECLVEHAPQLLPFTAYAMRSPLSCLLATSI